MLVTNSFTQQDLDGLKNGGKVSFDETTPKEVVLQTVKMINDYESTFEIRDFYQQVKLPTIEIDAKACSTDTLIALMDYGLRREDLLNASLILNIFNLIKQYNSLSESYFNNPRSYIKSIEEFIDLKASLALPIKQVCTRLAYWYLGALYSLHKTEITVIDKVEKIPNLYHTLLLSSDLFTLSAIFSKGDNVNTEELPWVDNAYIYVMELANRMCITNAFVRDIEKSLGLNSAV